MNDKKVKRITETIIGHMRNQKNKAPIILTTSKQVGFSVRCESCKNWEVMVMIVKDEHGGGIRFLCANCKNSSVVGALNEGN
ncbi:hypothetical protein LCGC14_1448510 [marine sediment metagenome]|uniref:Uncharacterized protein n=1 Tax=marine sediment metagenome TaxID=412755 RepID=A0A0F9LZ13_9ZZZZ